jgi:hypothetical protein
MCRCICTSAQEMAWLPLLSQVRTSRWGCLFFFLTMRFLCDVLFPYNAFSVRCSFSVQCVFCTMFFFRTMRFLYDVLFPYNAFSVRCSVSVQCFFCCPLICHLPLFLLLMLECRLRMACHARPAEDRGILLHIIAVFYLHLRLW